MSGFGFSPPLAEVNLFGEPLIAVLWTSQLETLAVIEARGVLLLKF